MKRAALIGLVAAIALGAGISAARFLAHLEKTRQSPLPEFSLADLSGVQHSIYEWQGKILIINFWATWCPPCRKEIPEFIALQEQYATKGVQFIGVAIDEQEAVSRYLSSTKINYPVLMGEDKGIALAHQLGNIIDAVPFTLVVDQQRQIIHRQPGEFSRDEILKIILPLMR
ncbi:Redoxin domain-containing protein [Candidatus Methylobacter favarea]|uniref:Redoxin domain-containing protein n=1 Tax=Candidatus Methylobacter favarea TaxID=2707345 RepID=A0A8S0Y626_9GAMM|nr:TlpA disulfide reductase family protein [Candidatus Methylobacter favarea]CAA9890330.1 Redoxin domain-containing protein [Candidatus Methylobacter favarea]